MNAGFCDYEHPDHGLVRVFYRWVPQDHEEFTWEPYAVEFDLFTSNSEREALLKELVSVRVDKSVSVSASGEQENSYV